MKMAENLDGCLRGDFSASIKKMKGAGDSAGDVKSIGSLFLEKYKKLYNCVSYDEHQMAALKLDIDHQILAHDTFVKHCKEHCITMANVIDGFAKLKRCKQYETWVIVAIILSMVQQNYIQICHCCLAPCHHTRVFQMTFSYLF